MTDSPINEIIHCIIVLALIYVVRQRKNSTWAEPFLKFLDQNGWQVFWLMVITKALPVIDKALNG